MRLKLRRIVSERLVTLKSTKYIQIQMLKMRLRTKVDRIQSLDEKTEMKRERG